MDSNAPAHSPHLDVLSTLLAWRREGRRAALVTVLGTYGASPRPAGSLAAIRDDGTIAGSVSGGCVEDALTHHLQARWTDAQAGTRPLPACERLLYGRDAEEQNRLRLPCGKQVHISVEYDVDLDTTERLVQALGQRLLVRRELRYADGRVMLRLLPPGSASARLEDGDAGHSHLLGPSHRLILIGANDVAAYIAPMAQALDFQVIVCDPREAYRHAWNVPGALLDARMPDDLVHDMQCDASTALIAVSHDPKLDDLALMEALTTPCFYIGVVGSSASVPKRRERLAMFDVTPGQLARLRSPAGLPIGSRTPPQIAVSVLAELIAAQQASAQAGAQDYAGTGSGCKLM